MCVLIQCISSYAHLQACSNLLISVESTSVCKLAQGWSVLNLRCSIEPIQKKGELLSALCWTESCGCSVLSSPFSCFCRCTSTHSYANLPAVSLGSQSLSCCATSSCNQQLYRLLNLQLNLAPLHLHVCGLGICEFLHPLFKTPFLVVNILYRGGSRLQKK